MSFTIDNDDAYDVDDDNDHNDDNDDEAKLFIKQARCYVETAPAYIYTSILSRRDNMYNTRKSFW